MEEIYKEYSKYIYKYLYSLTNDCELSEELMQETFCSAIKNIGTFRNECSIYSWLCQIAKNKWKNYQIKNGKIQMIQYDENIENLLSKNDIEDITQQLELQKEIQSLDKITIEVINLRINVGLTFKEIGKMLNKSEIWARTIFYRAKLKLRKSLDKK